MMRLSEAIRLGATMKPQAFEQIITADRSATCVWGAAIDAIGFPERDAEPNEVSSNGRGKTQYGGRVVALPPEWQKFTLRRYTCDECGVPCSSGVVYLAHLNDVHLWTRERIADFVELCETLPETPQEQPVERCT